MRRLPTGLRLTIHHTTRQVLTAIFTIDVFGAGFKRLALVGSWLVILVSHPNYGQMRMPSEPADTPITNAQRACFPTVTRFEEVTINLTKDDLAHLKKRSKTRLDISKTTFYKAYHSATFLGWYIQDNVIGKHDYITYAIGITPTGSVTGFEILHYRETHGGAVQAPGWRHQFLHKTSQAPLKLDQDIDGITGATLSAQNLTRGIKKLLVIHTQKLNTIQPQ